MKDTKCNKQGAKAHRILVRGLTGLAGLLLASSAQATILVFDFDVGGFAGNLSYITRPEIQPYGDNVSATSVPSPGFPGWTLFYEQGNGWTPDITAAYNVGTASTIDIRSEQQGATSSWASEVARLWPGGQTAAETDRRFYFTFDPHSGYSVQVNSFDLIRFDGNGNTGNGALFQVTADWELYDNASLTTNGSGQVIVLTGSLVAGGSVSLGDDSSDSASISTGAGVLTGPATLVIRDTSVFGSGNRLLALDNLNFDEFAVVPEPSIAALLAACIPLFFVRRKK